MLTNGPSRVCPFSIFSGVAQAQAPGTIDALPPRIGIKNAMAGRLAAPLPDVGRTSLLCQKRPLVVRLRPRLALRTTSRPLHLNDTLCICEAVSLALTEHAARLPHYVDYDFSPCFPLYPVLMGSLPPFLGETGARPPIPTVRPISFRDFHWKSPCARPSFPRLRQ